MLGGGGYYITTTHMPGSINLGKIQNTHPSYNKSDICLINIRRCISTMQEEMQYSTTHSIEHLQNHQSVMAAVLQLRSIHSILANY